MQGQKITPCLWFDHQAREAAEFYVGVFGGSVDRVHRSQLDTPGSKAGDVLFVEFTLAGQRYQALNGGNHVTFNDAISLSVVCEDQAEVDRLWEALTTNGGRPVQCGWLKDKYGLSWQIVPRQLFALMQDPDPARAKRTMGAMMEMVKLDVAKLQAAADGH
ncbi:MAG: VOC family protein [Hyphomicrobiales bacterium]|nr:MAG: VOC family protein [Hyphomicrobiales bacterium]